MSERITRNSTDACAARPFDAALAEIRRVLKPGGRFLFVEHIGAEEGTALARAQTLLRRPWAVLADRCNLMAQTEVAMARAGFSHVDSRIRDFGSNLDPSKRTLYGTATN